MNKEEFLKELKFLFEDGNEIGLSVYFILKTEVGLIKRQADVDQDVNTKLKDQFLTFIDEELIKNEDLVFTNLSTVDDRKNAIFSYDFDETPEGLEVMGELIDEEEQDIFNFNNDDFNSIFGFVILLGNETQKIALYKKHYPINIIKRDSNIFGFRDATRLVDLEDEMIRISEKFEFIQIGDEIIVLDLNVLERYFGFETVIKNKAATNITIIENSGFLENTQLLQELANDVRYAKKLMKVKADSVVFQLDFNKIRDFIRHHPKLKRRVRFNFNGSKIVLDTKVSAGLFLKLLDDDYLKSDLTDFLYETDRKSILPIAEETDDNN
jgi:hypothetical protein